jgi:hypothetical protein
MRQKWRLGLLLRYTVPSVTDPRRAGERYANKPVSSGRYKFRSLELGKKVVLVRARKEASSGRGNPPFGGTSSATTAA